MGKFRKASGPGRKGGTGKKTAGSRPAGRKASRGTGRGKGQSDKFIPGPRKEADRRKPGSRAPFKRFETEERQEKSSRPGSGRPARSNERPFKRRDEDTRSERPKRAFDDKSGNRPDFKRTSRSRSEGPSSFGRGKSAGRPAKGRSAGKFFHPDEKGLKERRKRIGQDDSFKRSGPAPSSNREERGSEKKWNRKESHNFYGDKRRNKSPEHSVPTRTASADSEEGIRLNKYISNAGICSRREADEMIRIGVISVNGEIITEMGYKVQEGDVVKYNNETLRGERLVYILLNKPKDFITTTDDPDERKTVMSLIAKACKERVYPVGRLDRNTTGVLLFTNDGDLARKLTHPSFEVHKIYQVELDKALKKADMDAITEGITLSDGFIKVDEVAYANEARDVIGVEIHSGRNRIVRRIFEHLDYKVKKLDRVVFAGLTKKDLPRGRWRFLTEMEVANLKMITGKKKRAF